MKLGLKRLFRRVSLGTLPSGQRLQLRICGSAEARVLVSASGLFMGYLCLSVLCAVTPLHRDGVSSVCEAGLTV